MFCSYQNRDNIHKAITNIALNLSLDSENTLLF